MKKYIDILLFTLLFFLIFSYFSGKSAVPELSGIRFEAGDSNYVVPAGVDIIVENNTTETVKLNTCEDISLRYEGKALEIPQELCVEKELLSREYQILDFAPYYSLFENPGDYTFELQIGEQKYVDQLEVEYRGAIGKIFT